MRDIELYLSLVILAGFASLPLTAQQSSMQNATQAAVPVESTANAPEVNNSSLRPVQGELESQLDSATAKIGDRVVLKTTGNATIANRVVIPSGSEIVGKVVAAQPAGNGGQSAKVAVLFDRALLRGGHGLPIKTVVQSVYPVEGASGTDVIASAGNRTPAVGTVVAKQGDVAIQTTAIPGVLIAANANGQPSNASGALIGTRQNVCFDGGTHMVLAVAGAGAKAGNARSLGVNSSPQAIKLRTARSRLHRSHRFGTVLFPDS